MENLQDLNEKELQEVDGGILGLLAWAFWGGVAYGYVKEKLDSGQW